MTEHAHEAQLIYKLCNEHCTRTASLFPGTSNCSNSITHPPLPLLSLGLIVNTFQCEHAPNFHQICWFLAYEILSKFLIKFSLNIDIFFNVLFLLQYNSSKWTAAFYVALLPISWWLSHYLWLLVKLYQSQFHAGNTYADPYLVTQTKTHLPKHYDCFWTISQQY